MENDLHLNKKVNIFVSAICDVPYLTSTLDYQEKTGYIILTTSPNTKYPYIQYLNPVLLIPCDDCDKEEPKFITSTQIFTLKDFLNINNELENLIVACDAGISRSPSIAIAILEAIGKKNEAIVYKQIFRYFNQDMYEVIKEELMI